MARNNARPRSALPNQRLVTPEFGARHPIVYSEDVDFFFGDIITAFSQVIPTKEYFDDHGNVTKTKRLYRAYDDNRRIGISVLERRLPRSYAQKQRIKWTKNDIGRITGQIQNELARLDMAGQTIEATFTQVMRLGDIDEGPNARKLGLVVDQKSNLSELLVREHELVVGGISGSLKRFRYPYDTFIPHWTVARIHQEAGTEAIAKAVDALQHLLPLTVEVSPIEMYSHQDIRI